MNHRLLTFTLLLVGFLALSAIADATIMFNGSVNSDIFEATGGNWTPNTVVSPGTPIDDDVVIHNVAATGAGGNFRLATAGSEAGASLTVSGTGSLNLTDSSIVQGGAGFAEPPRVQMSISNTAHVTIQAVWDVTITLSDSASLTLKGGGNPLNNTNNSVANPSIHFTSYTSSVHFLNETPSDVDFEHVDNAKFRVFDGLGLTTGPNANLSVVSDGGSGSIVTVLTDSDFDNNGFTDGLDFLILQRGLGITSGATNADGDANGDGAVDGVDLTIWESKYGSSATLLASSALSAVPEPSSCMLVVLSGIFLFSRSTARAKDRRL